MLSGRAGEGDNIEENLPYDKENTIKQYIKQNFNKKLEKSLNKEKKDADADSFTKNKNPESHHEYFHSTSSNKKQGANNNHVKFNNWLSSDSENYNPGNTGNTQKSKNSIHTNIAEETYEHIKQSTIGKVNSNFVDCVNENENELVNRDENTKTYISGEYSHDPIEIGQSETSNSMVVLRKISTESRP